MDVLTRALWLVVGFLAATAGGALVVSGLAIILGWDLLTSIFLYTLAVYLSFGVAMYLAVRGTGILGGFATGGFLRALAMYVAVIIASAILLSMAGYEDPLRDVLAQVRSDPMLAALVLVATVFLAPPVEELAFRAVLINKLRERLSLGWAVFASSAIFASLHLQVLTFPIYLALGLVLGYAYVRSGYAAAVAIHALNNSIAYAALWLGG